MLVCWWWLDMKKVHKTASRDTRLCRRFTRFQKAVVRFLFVCMHTLLIIIWGLENISVVS
jgi:hypothetical protein